LSSTLILESWSTAWVPTANEACDNQANGETDQKATHDFLPIGASLGDAHELIAK
jgi:hypothetical protein